jgi:serine/threonine protein kinase
MSATVASLRRALEGSVVDNFHAVRRYCDTLLDVDIDEIEGYRIRRALGAGSVGGVWMARDLTSGRFVVIKRVPVSVVPAPEVLRRDLALARGLDHPHVVGVIEVRQMSREWLVVSEHAPAGSLADLLNRRGPLSIGELVTLLTPITQALAAAQRTALAHDHLGTGDIVFTADGRPLVSDLGLRSTTQDTDHAGDPAALFAVARAAGADQSVFPESLFTSELPTLPSRLLSIATPAPIALAFARRATTTGAHNGVQQESGGRVPVSLDESAASAGFFASRDVARRGRATEEQTGPVESRMGPVNERRGPQNGRRGPVESRRGRVNGPRGRVNERRSSVNERRGRFGREHLAEMAERVAGSALSKTGRPARLAGLVTVLAIAVGMAGALTINAVRAESTAADSPASRPAASAGSIAPERPTADPADPTGNSADPSVDTTTDPSADPSVDPSADSSTGPTGGPTTRPTADAGGGRSVGEWARVLRGLDRVRAEAFARLDSRLLDAVYRRGTSPWRADRDVLTAYRHQATRIEGLRIVVQQVNVVRAGRGVVVLRVVDRFAGGTAVDPYGRRTQLPVGPLTARRITLTGSGNDWRISAIVRA